MLVSSEFQSPVAGAEAVNVMCEAMASRGPDGSGRWSDSEGQVFLGHQRLAILDVNSRSNQPFVSSCSRYVIVFNGEIYNFKDLRRELIAKGTFFSTESDTEVILQLYVLEGSRMLSKLRGMFSLAIWDKVKGSCLLARDPYGIKPLYISKTKTGWMFASQLKAIVKTWDEPCETDLLAQANFFMLGSVAGPQTWVLGVQEFPAGTWFDLSPETEDLNPISFWDIGESWLRRQVQCHPDELYKLVRKSLLETVKYHMVSDVPVGIFLSGGIDSGALTGLISELGFKDVVGITISYQEFEGDEKDEAPDASIIAEHYGIKHIVRKVTRSEYLADLPNIFSAMDQPTIDGVNTWYAAKAAYEQGLKVVISGVGGDELFFGYNSFRQLTNLRKVMQILSKIPGALLFFRVFFYTQYLMSKNRRWLSACTWLASISGAWWLRRSSCAPEELKLALGDAAHDRFVKSIIPDNWINELVGQLPHNEFLALAKIESMIYLRNQLLRDSDWASMAHGVEVRTPLVDAHLLNQLAPYLELMSTFNNKSLLAEAPSTPLPERIKKRKKTGFSIPIDLWLANNGVNDKLSKFKLIAKSFCLRN